MATFEIQGPDGSVYQIDGPDEAGALQALKKHLAGDSKPKGNAANWGMFPQAMDTITMGGASKLNAAAGGLVDAAAGAVRGQGFNYSDNYNKHLEGQRADQAAYNEQHPIRSGVGTGAGVALGVTNLPTIGRGLVGAAKTGAAYGGAGGALQDANSLTDRLYNMLWGAGTGGAIGAGGYGAGKVAGAGLTKLSRAIETVGSPPKTKAEYLLRNLANDAGGIAAVQKSLDDLGPDAMNVDVLGEKGRAMGRNASNISPEARETLETALFGRKSGQNQRMVADMEQAAGFAPGGVKSVETLTKESNDAFRPQVSALYRKAREAGKDMPLQYFDDVLGTDQGKAVLKEASNNVIARAKLAGNPNDISNLAVIDEMKKIFDSKASTAFRAGDNATGGLYADFAKSLRTRADVIMDSMDDPIYKTARSLAKRQKMAEEAITLGEQMGGSRIPLDLPQKTMGVDAANRQRLAQGYVAKKADTLLNRSSTDGAINELTTPMGRKAAEAALGPDVVSKSVNREKAFNLTTKALTGNSSTARQLAEMGATGAGSAAMAAGLGYDATTGGLAGLLASAARKGGPAISKAMATSNQRKIAPLIAEMLAGRGVPQNVASVPPGFLERLVGAGDKEKLAKALLMLFGPDVQTANPLTQRMPAR